MIEHEHDKVQSQTLYDLPCEPWLKTDMTSARCNGCLMKSSTFELDSGLTTFDASGGNQDQFNGYCDQKDQLGTE